MVVIKYCEIFPGLISYLNITELITKFITKFIILIVTTLPGPINCQIVWIPLIMLQETLRLRVTYTCLIIHCQFKKCVEPMIHIIVLYLNRLVA